MLLSVSQLGFRMLFERRHPAIPSFSHWRKARFWHFLSVHLANTPEIKTADRQKKDRMAALGVRLIRGWFPSCCNLAQLPKILDSPNCMRTRLLSSSSFCRSRMTKKSCCGSPGVVPLPPTFFFFSRFGSLSSPSWLTTTKTQKLPT